MPFTFKLSKRLALMKLSLAAVTLAACEQFPSSPHSSVVQVVIVPDSVTLDPRQTQQFAAYGRTQAGDSVAVAARWSGLGGTITSGGLYTADTVAGTYHVTATAPTTAASTTLTGSSVVKNRGPLKQIIVTPTAAAVLAGGTVQFAVYGRRANSDSVAVSVTYSATGGAIAAAGLYTAGQSAGTYGVVATQSGGTLAGSATVTVGSVPVATVTVSPAAPSLTAGQTVQLTAVTKDSAGNLLAGRTVTWTSSSAASATVSATGLVTGVAAGTATVTATSEGRSGTAAISVTAPANPGTVTDLAVVGVTQTGVTLAFTEVNDGTGLPASYNVRYQVGTITWGITATSVTGGTCATPLAGTAIGANRTCTVLGLQPGITYESQLIAFRGTLNLNAVFGGLSNIARAATSPSTAPVATVTVSPASPSVSVGATQQLSAVLKDASGNALTGRTVTWTSNNAAVASVSSAGLVTGLALGAATITATSEGQSGTAALTVANTGGAPQPGPTDTIILQDDFESGNLSLWTDAENNGRYSVSTDPTRVKSGTHSMQALYTTTNAYGLITRWFMPGYDEVYVKFSVMFEEGFQNKRPDGAGMHYFVLAGNRIDDSRSSWGKAAVVPNGTDYFYAGLDPEENSLPTLQPFSYYTYWPDMSCCYGNMFYQPSPKTALIGGQWQEVVFHIKLNTPGQSDGSQTVWINGVKKLDMQNMRWRTTTDVRLNEILFVNYMNTAPQTEHVWVDDVTVWRP